MNNVLIKRFEKADEIRTFEKGTYEVATVRGIAVGRAAYQPGWKWSVHVGPLVGASLCEVEHVGLVLAGCAKVRMRDGHEFDLRAGDFFYVGPGHDSWVVGNEPYVSLHFHGVEQYARERD
jgi:hypothetical protein